MPDDLATERIDYLAQRLEELSALVSRLSLRVMEDCSDSDLRSSFNDIHGLARNIGVDLKQWRDKLGAEPNN